MEMEAVYKVVLLWIIIQIPRRTLIHPYLSTVIRMITIR